MDILALAYELPALGKQSFTCPFCHTLAKQDWFVAFANRSANIGNLEADESINPFALRNSNAGVTYRVGNMSLSQCHSCVRTHLWLAEELLYPEATMVPPANQDTPPEILADYNEAASIVQKSPRGAAALLRLAIQKLCAHLGEPGQNINADIAALVAKGLDPRVQKALDVLRVVGNEAVHPGTLNLDDDPDTAIAIFRMFNLIVEKMISEPKHVDEVYALLPADKLAAIARRDQ